MVIMQMYLGIVLCLTIKSSHAGCCEFPDTPQNARAQLLKDLFINYDKRTRPVTNVKDTIQVHTYLHLYSIIDLDERDQVLKTSLGLRMVWNDSYLVWNSTAYEGIHYMFIPSDMAWTPDIVFRDSGKDPKPKELLHPEMYSVIEDFGQLQFFSIGELETSCKVDVTYFPFDTQECVIDLEIWVHNTKKVLLLAGTEFIDTEFYKANGQWELEGTYIESLIVKEYHMAFSHLNAHLYLRRKPLYFMLNVVFPCIIMSVMVCIVFIVPVEEGEKISFSVTVMLSFTVFLVVVMGSMPETSDSTPILSIYITFIMGMSAFSLIMSILVLRMHFKEGSHVPLPRWLAIMSTHMAKLLCLPASNSYKTRHNSYETRHRDQRINSFQHSKKFKDSSMKKMEANHVVPLMDRQSGNNTHFRQQEILQNGSSDNIQVLKDILKVLNDLKTTIGNENYTELPAEASDEVLSWHDASKIVDRFLFVVYVIVTLVVSVFMLVVFPLTQGVMHAHNNITYVLK